MSWHQLHNNTVAQLPGNQNSICCFFQKLFPLFFLQSTGIIPNLVILSWSWSLCRAFSFHFHVQNLLQKFVSYILKLCPYQVILLCIIHYGACGSTFGWGTALQVGRSRVWFLMVSLGFFIDIILPIPLGLTQPLTEMSTRNISWGCRQPVHRADNLTTFMCRRWPKRRYAVHTCSKWSVSH